MQILYWFFMTATVVVIGAIALSIIFDFIFGGN
jgi:hypothetical protein